MPPRRQPPSADSPTPAKLADVAALAEVSPAVVSRILREDPTLRVREETRRRVREAAERLRYAPNQHARALRSASSGVLGIAVHDTSNPIYSEILAGAQAEASAAGIALLLADADELARNEEVFARVVRGNRIDGLLLQRGPGEADAALLRIASAHLPVLLLNDRTRGAVGGVALDDEAATHTATRHLLDLGHTLVGHLHLGSPKGRSAARTRGWRRALREAGLTGGPELCGGHTIASGRRALAHLTPGAATGLVVSNVLAAVGVMSAAREQGLRVPEDLSVVGVHDVFFAPDLSPPLTVVRMPLRELGRRAVAAMLDRLAGGPPRQELVTDPPPQLLVRGSTAPPRPAR